MAEGDFYITFPNGERKEVSEPGIGLAAELTAPRFMPVIGAPAVYDPHRCYPMHVAEKSYTVHVNLDERGKRAMKEMARFLRGKDCVRREQALRDGLRLLKMWQKEKEPHRKAYYWHLHELKLARALGKDWNICFMLDGRKYELSRTIHNKVRISRMED